MENQRLAAQNTPKRSSLGELGSALLAISTLVVSLWMSRGVSRKVEFEVLLMQFDRKAAERDEVTRRILERVYRKAADREKLAEAERDTREVLIRELCDRNDKKFEALLARNSELVKRLAELSERVKRSEVVH